MSFVPPHCPRTSCPSRAPGAAFTYRPAGTYRRKVDGRVVLRQQCESCLCRFSEQTFRSDYRQQRPALSEQLVRHLVSEVSCRQAARILGCNRKTVQRRIQQGVRAEAQVGGRPARSGA